MNSAPDHRIYGPQKPDVPVFAATWSGAASLNERLSGKLTEMSRLLPTAGSNMPDNVSYFSDKWLSDRDLHTLEDADFQELVRFTESVGAQLTGRPRDDESMRVMSMWCIVSDSGMQGRRHHHRGMMSTAYYVETGTSGAKDGGLIQFYRKDDGDRPALSLVPQAGTLLLFPSGLEHSVNPYCGTSSRIVISMNLDWQRDKPT